MSICIAAIPEKTDPVWKYSSEPIPHMTLLMLDDIDDNEELFRVAEFIQHAAERSMFPFWMSVKERGVLGDKNADVLFFDKDKHGKAMLDTVRQYFLSDSGIFTAYSSFEQYPEWTPHLTLGYPETPAKMDQSECVDYVRFDRIAMWVDDYNGPEFRLEGRDYEQSDMAMSDVVEDFLEHFGVKGMHWGVRKEPRQLNTRAVVVKKTEPGKTPMPLTKDAKYYKQNADTAVTVVHRPNQRLATQGGSNRKPHEDAIKTAAAKRIAKSSTTDALSTKELQELVSRMNLEQQYAKLTTPPPSGIKKLVDDLINGPGQQQLNSVANFQSAQYLYNKGLGPKPKGMKGDDNNGNSNN